MRISDWSSDVCLPICQQRTHLAFFVALAITVISCASSSASSDTSPLISRKRSSSTSGASQFWSDTPHFRAISASSAAPISPPARIGSSTLATCSRSASSASNSLAEGVASPSIGARTSYQVANSTLSLRTPSRSEEHTSKLQSLMRLSYAVFCLKKKKEKLRQRKKRIITTKYNHASSNNLIQQDTSKLT